MGAICRLSGPTIAYLQRLELCSSHLLVRPARVQAQDSTQTFNRSCTNQPLASLVPGQNRSKTYLQSVVWALSLYLKATASVSIIVASEPPQLILITVVTLGTEFPESTTIQKMRKRFRLRGPITKPKARANPSIIDCTLEPSQELQGADHAISVTHRTRALKRVAPRVRKWLLASSPLL